jgi:hypothetical protein
LLGLLLVVLRLLLVVLRLLLVLRVVLGLLLLVLGIERIAQIGHLLQLQVHAVQRAQLGATVRNGSVANSQR